MPYCSTLTLTLAITLTVTAVVGPSGPASGRLVVVVLMNAHQPGLEQYIYIYTYILKIDMIDIIYIIYIYIISLDQSRTDQYHQNSKRKAMCRW